jgi:regulator of sigma E protease
LNIIIAILIFGIIIIIHELGHFLIAKKNGIRVDEFCVGLGPKIIGKKFGETEYALRLLPFGGACMMGEDEERDEPDAFNNKSVYARMAVIFGGPLFNFILAFVLSFIMIAMSGADIPKVYQTEKNSPIQEAGVKSGDILKEIDGKRIYNYRELSYYFMLNYKGGSLPLTIEHNGKEKIISVTPKYDKQQKRYLVGVTWKGYEKVGPLQTIEYSFHEVSLQIRVTLKSVAKLVTGQLSMKDLSGPVGIVKQVGDTYNSVIPFGLKALISTMLSIAVLISANLGVMNLLPLPALDGGRLCFLILEALRGKPIKQEIEAYVHGAGLILLLALMIFVMYQDVLKIF